jgi:hypothetical protein
MWMQVDEARMRQVARALREAEMGDEAAYVERLIENYEKSDTAQVYLTHAREVLHEEGFLEFDEDAAVSMMDGGDGAYVMAWSWVSASDVGLPVVGG